VAQSWRRNWEQVIPFFAFAPEVRQWPPPPSGPRKFTVTTTRLVHSEHSVVRRDLAVYERIGHEAAQESL